MPLDRRPKPVPDFLLENLDGEFLLYHPTMASIFYCNPTASLIWQLCDGQRTIAEIITLLREAYPEASETLANDVCATLETFQSHGALTWI